MHAMEELRDMLCEELEKLTKTKELSAGSLDAVDKLTHSIKSIDTIMAMEEAGYSNDGSYDNGMHNYSGARGRNGYARRDSMGRYSREGRSYGRYSRNYSGDTKQTIEQIERMLDELKGQG